MTSIIRLENEHLDDDSCFLSTLINISENIFIEKNMIVLERHDTIIKIDLEDIFSNNMIRVPTPTDNVNKHYFAESCDDLKPLIKNISWKDTRFLITEELYVKEVLTKIYLDTQKTVNPLYAYINEHNKIINLLNSENWGIKIQNSNKGFGVFGQSIFFFNVNQFNKQSREQVTEIIKLIMEEINE
jgi:hypothetical protein